MTLPNIGTNYLHIYSLAGTQVTVKQSVDIALTLYISRDASDWSNMSSGQTYSGTHIYLCGEGNTILSYSNTPWTITDSSNQICIDGNIETLLDYSTVSRGEHPSMSVACYESMFEGCTGLVKAPELPATTLKDYCYSNMFYGCTSLTHAPELPATTLTSYCYDYMFKGCINLTQAPKLPATTLTEGCYQHMFDGCTSLTQAPELPATTLAYYCYASMFYGCTSLTQAPELPATTLKEGCYGGMFYGCTSLEYVYFYGDEVSKSASWLYGVSTSGTFYHKSNFNIPSSFGASTIPSGWTLVNIDTLDQYFLAEDRLGQALYTLCDNKCIPLDSSTFNYKYINTSTGLVSYDTEISSNSASITLTNGGLVASSGIKGQYVYGGVWNDLVDCISVPEDTELEYGYCYCFDGEKYYKSSKYLDDGIIGIHSDTSGFQMGHKKNTKEMDVAVSGFVLAYVDKEYPVGTPLTCAENGYLTEILLNDKKYNYEKIVGTYWKNELNHYWGSDKEKVLVNGRHWVKIK